MTLSDMAEFICAKINQSETEDVAAAKLFLARRHEMIWADQLWKDSLYEYTQTISSSGWTPEATWLPNKRILLLPTVIEYPVALRTGDRQLTPDTAERLYRMDYDTFTQSGNAQHFLNLPRAFWQFEPDTNGVADWDVLITPGDPTDAGQSLSADYENSETGSENRSSAALGAVDPVLLASASRVDRISKGVTTGTVAIQVAYPTAHDYVTLATLQAQDKAAPLRCRIQIMGTLSEGAVLRVLGKRSCPQLSDDNDSPAITGCDNTLLAFGLGDLLVRGRQYGKAAAAMQEAVALLEQLKKTQTVQQAYNKRLMPADGFGSDYWVYGQPPLTF